MASLSFSDRLKRSLSKRILMPSGSDEKLSDGRSDSSPTGSKKDLWGQVKKSLSTVIQKSDEPPNYQVNPLLHDDFRRLRWSMLEEVESAVQEGGPELIVMGIGVNWCLPCLSSFNDLMQVANTQTNVKAFIIDAERHRPFCAQKELMIGTTAFMMWGRGARPVVFLRPERATRDVLVGSLNVEMLTDIVHAAQDAIAQVDKEQFKGKAKGPLPPCEIHIHF